MGGDLRRERRPGHSTKRGVDGIQGVVLRLPIRKAGISVPQTCAWLKLEAAQLQIARFGGSPFRKCKLHLAGHKRVRLYLVMKHDVEDPGGIGWSVMNQLRLPDQIKLTLVADHPRVDHDAVLRRCQRAAAYDSICTVLV